MKWVTEEEKRRIDLANWATVYPESMEDLKKRVENINSDPDTLFRWFEKDTLLTDDVETALNALECIQQDNEDYIK